MGENNYENNWGNFDDMPAGGYLNDMWFYTKHLDYATTPGETFKSNEGLWQYVFPQEEC